MAGMVGFDNSTSILMAQLEEDLMNAQRGWFTLDLDLNYPLSHEDMPSYALYSFTPSQNVQSQVNGPTQQQTEEGVQVIDNEIAIISRSMFLEARKKARRRYDASIEDTVSIQSINVPQFAECSQIVRPPPEAPIFRCPICLDELTEATSTKCGHIFCKECIENAIAVQKKCPTCRKKFRGKGGLIKVYLPEVI